MCVQGEPMPEMLQLHSWLESHIPAGDSEAAGARISHGDYRWAGLCWLVGWACSVATVLQATCHCPCHTHLPLLLLQCRSLASPLSLPLPSRLDNLVFDSADPSRVLAVLDWELSTLGDPLADLAYNCMPYHLPAVSPEGAARGYCTVCLALA